MGDAGTTWSPRRCVVIMPTWLGDVVMATPLLRALRALWPAAQVTALVRPQWLPVLDAVPWLDEIIPTAGGGFGGRPGRPGVWGLASQLRAISADLALLLPNSFRWALAAALSGTPRRMGYARECRGMLLTDRLKPLRREGKFVPVPTLEYYLQMAQRLGAVDPDPAMALFTRESDDVRAREMLAAEGVDPQKHPLVILNPGANFGDAKMWYPQRFAAVADELAQRQGAAVAVSGAPNERPILDQVVASARTRIIDLPRLGVDLRLLKSVLRLAHLLVTNDTGPRHMAAALGAAVVTIFGPTDPAWTTINYALEREVAVKVFCGPCQKKKCPLDHRCMNQVSVEMVTVEAEALLRRKGIAGRESDRR